MFIEPLPGSDRGDTHPLKYAVNMGSIAMICMPSLRKIGSGFQKVIEGFHRHTDIMEIA
jgi:hypothetical protein